MLNKQQQAVVGSNSKRKAVIAGAGAGKSTTIVQVIKKDTERVPIENMVAITFTRFASQELKEKIEGVGVNSKDMFAGTIHAFCLEILTQYIDRIGWDDNFALFDQDDRNDILKYIVTTTNIIPTSMKLQDALEDIRYSKRIIDEYESIMQQFNAIDLSMIISKTVELLHEPDVLSEVKEKYKAFYVDEFQDTYQEQIDILELIDPEYLVIIGDPDQAIYEWNKAKPEYLVNIQSIFDGIEMFKLETNYRSTHQIVDAANKLISHNQNRIDKTLISIREGDEVNYKLDFYNANEQFEAISNTVKGQTAIICRKNATAVAIGDYLVNKGIQVNMMLSSVDIMKKEHIKGVLAIANASINESNDYSLMKALKFLNTLPHKDLMKKYNDCISNGTYLKTSLESFSEDLNAVLDKIYALNDKILITDAYEFINKVVLSFNVYGNLIEQHRATKVKQTHEFLEIVKRWKIRQMAKFSDTGIKAFLRWVMLRDIQETVKKDPDAINIMTVHGSKGLEFDNVIIPNVFESEYPMMRSGNIEEERRLFYVAITRAKKELAIMSCDTKRVRNGIELATKPSIFIKEMKK